MFFAQPRGSASSLATCLLECPFLTQVTRGPVGKSRRRRCLFSLRVLRRVAAFHGPVCASLLFSAACPVLVCAALLRLIHQPHKGLRAQMLGHPRPIESVLHGEVCREIPGPASMSTGS